MQMMWKVVEQHFLLPSEAQSSFEMMSKRGKTQKKCMKMFELKHGDLSFEYFKQ